jgi:hypothetical protein
MDCEISIASLQHFPLPRSGRRMGGRGRCVGLNQVFRDDERGER